MDARTGDLYPTKEDAINAGVPEWAAVEVKGHPKGIGRLRMAAKNENAKRKKARKLEKSKRRANKG